MAIFSLPPIHMYVCVCVYVCVSQMCLVSSWFDFGFLLVFGGRLYTPILLPTSMKLVIIDKVITVNVVPSNSFFSCRLTVGSL